MENSLVTAVYRDFAEFLAGLSPEKIMSYHPSQIQQNRLEELVKLKRAGTLTKAQKAELEHFKTIERIIRLAKAHALMLMTNEPAYS